MPPSRHDGLKGKRAMTRRTVEETERFHLFLYKRDLEYLRRRFGSGTAASVRLGVGTACREIIHERIKRLRAKENDRLSALIASRTQAEDEEELVE